MLTEITSKMKINKPTNEVYKAIVDPGEIGNFWFTSSSERWVQGKKITLKYVEYEAELLIKLLEIEENKRIVFSWGEEHNEETVVTITLVNVDQNSTIIEVNESGFIETDPELVNKLLGQKEGWVYMLSCLKGFLEHGVTDLRASLVH
jgi:uncharacterized protein YndB with AHSA1/START domain